VSDGVSLCDRPERVKLTAASCRQTADVLVARTVDTPANHDYPGLEKRRGRWETLRDKCL
jgi:hypothetical protein